MTSFRQIDEKHVIGEVSMMQWSPKMDLIAVALAQGEVSLHRLSWQKVWLLPAGIGADHATLVSALCWHPDGKMLAVAYDTGHVCLCHVENGAVIHSYDLDSAVTCMLWTAASGHLQSNMQPYFCETSGTFLPKLPALSASFSSVNKTSSESMNDLTNIDSSDPLNILIAGTKGGFVHLYSFGVFPSGQLQPKTICADIGSVHISILSVAMSDDLNCLTVLLRRHEANNHYDEMRSFKMPLVADRSHELKLLALKFGRVSSLMSYMSNTIKAISEAWENILLQIDSKLTNFAQEKYLNNSGSVSDDFVELLVFGTATIELEKFLLQDLTEKGLKKLGHSIEMSYSNIHKLVLKHLQNAGQALMYHLSEIKGMALWHDRFGVLGLTPKSVDGAIKQTGAFMMKAAEIQQVIDSSMKNFKVFFRWLYSVILRLCDESIPSEFNKITQQDLKFVAEFLIENFTEEWSEEKKCSFNLERVGQYLKNESLAFPASTKANPWIKFLDDIPSFKDNTLLFNHDADKSLIQQHNDLQSAINSALSKPATTLGHTVALQFKLALFETEKSSQMKCSHITNATDKSTYTAITCGSVPCHQLYFIRQSASGNCSSVCIVFGKVLNSDSSSEHFNYGILDFQFYNSETISLLLLENGPEPVAIMVQFSMRIIDDNLQDLAIESCTNLHSSVRTVDVGSLVEQSSSRRLDNLSLPSFCVSGTRKVACVLFGSKRRVRLFEMDAEDEEEDETTDINMSKESMDDSLNESATDAVFNC